MTPREMILQLQRAENCATFALTEADRPQPVTIMFNRLVLALQDMGDLVAQVRRALTELFLPDPHPQAGETTMHTDHLEGFARTELAVAESILLGQANMIQEIFPSITRAELVELFAGLAAWHDDTPVLTDRADAVRRQVGRWDSSAS